MQNKPGSQQDCIVACATAPGRAGIAVIRISGATSFVLLQAMLATALPPPRTLLLRTLFKPRNLPEESSNCSVSAQYNRIQQNRLPNSPTAVPAEALDQVLVAIFPAPNSYSGEDLVEIHCHGSSAVVAAILSACCSQPGVRLAQPGEFTRRAVLNGKLSLWQAEATLNLIDAETEAQRQLAISASDVGAISDWQAKLAQLLAQIEAEIDFAASENLTIAGWPDQIRELIAEMETALAATSVQAVLEGIKIAIIGAVNVGKSSIYNMLLGRTAAIVTATAGTTRDQLEAVVNLAGYRLLLLDTAGLRVSKGKIEQLGIERSEKLLQTADIILSVQAVSPAGKLNQQSSRRVAALDSYLQQQANRVIPVINKIDYLSAAALRQLQARMADQGYVYISAISGAGKLGLQTALTEMLEREFPLTPPSWQVTRARHRECLRRVVENLQLALTTTNMIELSAEHVRHAYQALLELTGKGGVEQILDNLFQQFCIGK